tara:strand:+ start:131 stop:565 length:435 start_codon:yes stop_codon:yes gene_type:complete
MKTKLNFSKTLVLALFFGFLANAKTTPDPHLPEPALDFLKKHFTVHTVSQIHTGKINGRDYHVTLSNGITVQFDSNGNWKGINGNYHALPETVLPKEVASHIAGNFNSQIVIHAVKKSWGYKVALMNGTTLEYNNSGKFLRIDK